MGLKERALENENILLEHLDEQYKKHINNIISKIKSLDYDGDIAKYINSRYFIQQKRTIYNYS